MSLSWGKSVRAFQKSTKNTDKRMSRDIQKVVDKTGMEALRNAENLTPVKTGKLKSGWKIARKGKGGKRRTEISNNIPYAVFVENGTNKTSPRNMLRIAMMIADAKLQKRLKALKSKTAKDF